MSDKLKEYGILFNEAMVLAIQKGIKTVTRRPMKVQPPGDAADGWGLITTGVDRLEWIKVAGGDRVDSIEPTFVPPYGFADTVCWVREAFADVSGMGFGNDPRTDEPWRWAYRAGTEGDADDARKAYGVKWTPSIHMPREASRFDLVILALRHEPLRAITQEGVEAEGSPGLSREQWGMRWDAIYGKPSPVKHKGEVIEYVSYLWDGEGTTTGKFNGLPYRVHRNPEVWVYDFRVGSQP